MRRCDRCRSSLGFERLDVGVDAGIAKRRFCGLFSVISYGKRNPLIGHGNEICESQGFSETLRPIYFKSR